MQLVTASLTAVFKSSICSIVGFSWLKNAPTTLRAKLSFWDFASIVNIILLDHENQFIQVQIVDYGKGIDDVDQAMQPFYTTVPGEERSGMGFTVMQAFCEKVEVASGNGCTSVLLQKYIK